jgi:uncharacterized protein YigE (DUF2233 family)
VRDVSRLPRVAAIAVLATVLLACSSPSSTVAPTSTHAATPSPPAGPAAGASPASPAATAASRPDPADAPTVQPTALPVQLTGHGAVDVVTLPLDDWDVRVDWPMDPDGTDLGTYITDHPDITMLTNAGIFSTDLRPGGLLVADGEVLRELNLADGAGNFHLKPNAVFAIHDDGTASVVDATAHDPTGVQHATQSGPALLLDGSVHPAFREGSENLAIRSGVGVSPDGHTVYLALSHTPVNLWDFATMFRDDLGVDDALYLDGQISQLWIRGVTDDPISFLGPYAGVITAAPR